MCRSQLSATPARCRDPAAVTTMQTRNPARIAFASNPMLLLLALLVTGCILKKEMNRQLNAVSSVNRELQNNNR